MNNMKLQELIAKAIEGDRVSISKIITKLEYGDTKIWDEFLKIVNQQKKAEKHHFIGFVGPPGAGKSTLIANLAKNYFKAGKVGVLTIDPSSPYTGGSFLGNRIRMLDALRGMQNVYCRSFASRGSLGGMSTEAYMASKLLSVCGFTKILLEGVGAGHLDIKPLLYSHTRVIILTPASGDYVQMLKSGVMELGDIYVINKLDVGSPHKIKQELEEVVNLKSHTTGWKIPVLLTNAVEGIGVDQLAEAINIHYEYLLSSGLYNARCKEMDMSELKDIFISYAVKHFEKIVAEDSQFLTAYRNISSIREIVAGVFNKIVQEINAEKTASIENVKVG